MRISDWSSDVCSSDLFGIGGAIAAVPTFLTLERVTSPVVATLVILVPITLQSGYTANNALVKAELFPAHIRGLGVALPYAIGDRKSVVSGKRVSVRVDLGGRRKIKKKNTYIENKTTK